MRRAVTGDEVVRTLLLEATKTACVLAGRGHERVVPVADRFFTTLADYLDHERPDTTSDRVFIVLKGPNRCRPLSAAGVDEIFAGGRGRAGLKQVTCHMLRHTCLTRPREAGMALEAVQAQAGHRSIESTRIYLLLADRWLAEEYHRAVDTLEQEIAGMDVIS